ncbi:MAG: hypothetical protein HQL63_01305 [Magnetococcales bacterium]|nr:hypothetical protein [Magnetococcales bacterium]MBF0322114.1 hypothetical protein [Magnetococcales bacterium]
MIDQQINLYQSQFHIKKEFLVARGMFLVGLLFILFLVLVSGVMNWLAAREEGHLQLLVEQQNQKSELLQDLVKKFPPPKESTTLRRKADELEKEVKRMHRVADLLKQNQTGNARGFSAILEALGREKVDGLWLDGIGVFSGGEDLVLEGKTKSAELVPLYLQHLSRQKIFSGRRFSHFQMSEDIQPNEETKDKPVPVPTIGAGGPLIRFQIKTIDQDIRRDQALSKKESRNDPSRGGSSKEGGKSGSDKKVQENRQGRTN